MKHKPGSISGKKEKRLCERSIPGHCKSQTIIANNKGPTNAGPCRKIFKAILFAQLFDLGKDLGFTTLFVAAV